MWNRMKTLPLLLYMNITGALRDFKDDQRGLSGVVVAVLLILVAVLAVVAIWAFLGEWLEGLWTRITEADTIG